jgi:hypothetical protein
VVRIPLRNLTASRPKRAAGKGVAGSERKKRQRGERRLAGEDLVLRNLITLLFSLRDVAGVKSSGVKILSVDERAELSLDTSSFPMVELADKSVIVLDYRGVLSEELKEIIEVSWPDYRVVSCRGMKDLKNSVGALLDSIGYSSFSNSRVTLWDTGRIELLPDFVVMKMDDDILSAEIVAINIVKPGEYGTPQEFKDWAGDKGVRIVELHTKEPPLVKAKAQTVSIKERQIETFSERFLRLFVHNVKRGESFNFSERDGYRFAMRTDISFRDKNRVKAIQFSKVPTPYLKYARKHGIEVLSLNPADERTEVLKKMLALVSLGYKEKPEVTSSVITPKKTKYRLFAPGILVRSRRDLLFLAESGADERLLSSLMDSRVKLVTF